MTPEAALQRVFELVGSKGAVARELEISPQAVSQWRVAPSERALQLASLTSGEVSVHQLRPDIFGPQPQQESRIPA